jgi:hypothetical protein
VAPLRPGQVVPVAAQHGLSAIGNTLECFQF